MSGRDYHKPVPHKLRRSEFYQVLAQALRGDDEFYRAIADMYLEHTRQSFVEGVQLGYRSGTRPLPTTPPARDGGNG